MCDLEWIRGMPRLESLSVEGLDACVKAIEDLPCLRSLRIARMHVRALDTMCRIRPPALRALTVESIIHKNKSHYISILGRLSMHYDLALL